MNDSTHPDSAAAAADLIDKIDYEFLCRLGAWKEILNEVNLVNNLLQDKTLTLDNASNLIEGLRNILQNVRDNELKKSFKYANRKARALGIDADFSERRPHKTRIIALYESDDTVQTPKDQFKREIMSVLDTIMSQCQ